MQLSKWGYRADFIAYPVLIALASLEALRRFDAAQLPRWVLALIAGWLAWTAVEYVMHRWLFHELPPFLRLHGRHHEQPRALIGTPTWISAPLFIALWALLEHLLPAADAAGLATGLMSGYLGYVWLHDAVHHRAARSGSWLHTAQRRHALHHRRGAACNYGVSTGFWDWLLGTETGRYSR